MAKDVIQKPKIEYVDNTQTIASMLDLPNGFFNVRVGQITSDTKGVPADLVAGLRTYPWQIQGAWQANGFYKGLLYISYPNPVSIPRIILVFGTRGQFDYISIDGTQHWTATIS